MLLAVPAAHLWGDLESGERRALEGLSGTHAGPGADGEERRVCPLRAAARFSWSTREPRHATIDTVGSSCDTFLAVYAQSGGMLELIQANDHAEGRSRISYDTEAGREYVIAVDGFSHDGELTPGAIRLNWMTNQHLAAAQPIEGASGSVYGNNVFAVKEEGEPDHAGRPGGGSVWYRWTAPANAKVVFDTAGSTFSTLLAVYTGTTYADLELMAANDNDDDIRPQSRVRFEAAAGTTYVIAVDGCNDKRGEIVLNWGPPANNDFARPQDIEGPGGSVHGNTSGATSEDGERAHAGEPGGASVWYRWTAPASGEVTMDTRASTFDTLLAVYTGTTLARLEQVAANDDHPALADRESLVTFHATAATTYVIAVDGYVGETGDVMLNWQLAGEPPQAAA